MSLIQISYLDGGIIQIRYAAFDSVNIKENILPEIYSWCKENIPKARIGDGGYHTDEHMHYVYIDNVPEEELMAFKLRWS